VLSLYSAGIYRMVLAEYMREEAEENLLARSAGTGNGSTERFVRHSRRKQGATDRSFLRGAAAVLDPIDLESAIFRSRDETTRKLRQAVKEFYIYIDRNRAFIPNYDECYRNGERISTGFVESAVNQVISKRMAKKQQMQWSRRGRISCCKFELGC
jgi:hypothetical protein